MGLDLQAPVPSSSDASHGFDSFGVPPAPGLIVGLDPAFFGPAYKGIYMHLL